MSTQYTKGITGQPTIEACKKFDIETEWLPLTQKGNRRKPMKAHWTTGVSSHQMVWNDDSQGSRSNVLSHISSYEQGELLLEDYAISLFVQPQYTTILKQKLSAAQLQSWYKRN